MVNGAGRAKTSGLDVLQAQADMGSMRRATLEWWESGWDLLLTPTTLVPPPLVGELVSTEDEPMRNSLRSIPYAAFTSPSTLLASLLFLCRQVFLQMAYR